MDPESVKGKWVAEAYDLLRLFRFVGRSIAGLLLVLTLWSFFVTLVLKSLISAGDPPGVRNPFGWLIGPDKLPLLDVWLVGIGLILAWWAWWSGAYQLILGPLRVGRLVVLGIVLVASILMVPIAIVWLLIASPVESWRIRRWRRSLSEQQRSKLDAALPLRANRNLYAEKSGFSKERPLIWLRGILDRLGAARGRVGLAPFVSHSYSEELVAAKGPPQAFGWAIERTVQQIGALNSFQFVKISTLPAIYAVRTQRQATLVHWLFSCDVLVWGSYLAQGDGQLWLNFRLPKSNTRIKTSTPRSASDFRPEPQDNQLFPWSFHVNVPAVTVSQNDPWEIYAALLFAIIMLLESRQGARVGFEWAGGDPLHGSAAEAREIWDVFLEDVFPRWVDPINEQFFSPLRQAATRLVGSWVGSKISRVATPDQRTLSYCHSLAAKCVRLLPNEPTGWYRLGALECASGSILAGINAFRKAGRLEAQFGRTNPIWPSVAIDLEGENAAENDLALARIAAHVACAISVGDDYDLNQMQEKLQKITSPDMFRLSDRGKEIISALADLLQEARLSHTRRLAERLWDSAGRPAGRDGEFWNTAETMVREGKSRWS